ncbi:hypothetical protein GGTG_04469 [Gaeumannomyces tritici R3-111a-1]|uniref:Uncharacterized protein n=1 Tax=Gaeumannomyces tritici (strain R3-111a-1) TaxID=644352 RepID=J3NT71_GAET3|nr:hypothetical protein GGTG_04469 [Gaeumannomyces tritici R3-111a-1]EJT79385.1 hypothetical protein GGTG_04469 [Gaeumannomyces tritici R3-111a-1]
MASGFLAPRSKERAYVTVSGDGDGQEPLYICRNFDNFDKDVLQGRLNTRGWVYQERALDRRTIFFTKQIARGSAGAGKPASPALGARGGGLGITDGGRGLLRCSRLCVRKEGDNADGSPNQMVPVSEVKVTSWSWMSYMGQIDYLMPALGRGVGKPAHELVY